MHVQGSISKDRTWIALHTDTVELLMCVQTTLENFSRGGRRRWRRNTEKQLDTTGAPPGSLGGGRRMTRIPTPVWRPTVRPPPAKAVGNRAGRLRQSEAHEYVTAVASTVRCATQRGSIAAVRRGSEGGSSCGPGSGRETDEGLLQPSGLVSVPAAVLGVAVGRGAKRAAGEGDRERGDAAREGNGERGDDRALRAMA